LQAEDPLLLRDGVVSNGADGDLHGRLLTRVAGCWARLEDVVSELYAVHEFDEEAIVERVRAVIDAERDAA
jgi:hypothetical protein